MDVTVYGFACEAERPCTWLDCREIFSEMFISVGLLLLPESITFVTRFPSRSFAISRRRDARIIIPGSSNSNTTEVEFLIAFVLWNAIYLRTVGKISGALGILFAELIKDDIYIIFSSPKLNEIRLEKVILTEE